MHEGQQYFHQHSVGYGHTCEVPSKPYCQFLSIQFNLFRQIYTIEYNVIYIYTFTTVTSTYKLD